MAGIVDLLRSGRILFLLDLTWGGVVYRLSTEEIEETIDGEERRYHDALGFADSWERTLDLFAVSPSERAITVSLDLTEIVDTPARVAEGHPLAAATARLAFWVEGSSISATLLDGVVRQAEYGAFDEPVTLTIEERPLIASGLIPDTLQRVQWPAEFSNLAPRVMGQYYPTIIGYPGGAAGWGSPALLIDPFFGAASFAVAAHECVAGNIDLVDDATGTSAAIAVQVERDNNQADVLRTAVDAMAPPFAGTNDAAYYIRWTPGQAGGVPSRKAPSVPMRGAGEVLTYLLERAGVRFDRGRMAALEPLLDGYRLDAAIVPGDERISPIEWLQRHLIPILPLSADSSPAGIFYSLWRWAVTERDVVLTLNADDEQCSRVGAVEYSDRDKLYQEIRLDYAFDYRANSYAKSMTFTGDREFAKTDASIVLDPFLEYGFNLHARSERQRIRPLSLSTSVVMDDATASLVLQYLARRHGLQSRLVRYEADVEFSWLEAGAVIQITDAELSLVNAVAVVESVLLGTNESVGLALRLLPNPGGRR